MALFKREKPKNPFSGEFGHLIRKYLKKEDTNSLFIIDIGANKGGFFDETLELFKNTKIDALLIEPIPECYELLNNKYCNNKNIIILNCAVSDVIGKANFFINEFDETSSLLKIKDGIPELKSVNTELKKQIEVKLLTLDEILSNNNKTIDIVKIDVQGAEHKVLDGAKNSCEKIKFIWIEVSYKSLYEGSSTFNEIYTKLIDMGFVLLELTDGYRASNKELVQGNCLFINKLFL